MWCNAWTNLACYKKIFGISTRGVNQKYTNFLPWGYFAQVDMILAQKDKKKKLKRF